MPGYRARPNEIMRRCIDLGIPPQGAKIARATGLPPRTVARMLAGGSPSARTMAAFCDVLKAREDQLFTRDGADAPAALRAVR